MQHNQPPQRCTPPTVCKASTAADSLAELRQWMGETEEMGVPHFGEFGFRLDCYRTALAAEFSREESRSRMRGDADRDDNECQELIALRSQHGQFLDELENMSTTLHQSPPPFETWQEATRQFDELQSEIDRHRKRERQLIDTVNRTDAD